MDNEIDLSFANRYEYISMCYPDSGKSYSIELRHPNWFQRQVWRFLLGWKIEKDE